MGVKLGVKIERLVLIGCEASAPDAPALAEGPSEVVGASVNEIIVTPTGGINVSGPHLELAVLCERVLQEKDGVMSLIRIVDRFNVSGTEREMPPSVLKTNLVVALKAGDFYGKGHIKIKCHSPTGKAVLENEFPVLLESQDGGAGIVATVTFQIEEEGLYWIDVAFEDSPMTRIPLRVVYSWAGKSGPQKN